MNLEKLPVGLTYSDVLLVPQYSSVRPSKVNVNTQLTSTINMPTPIIAAAMDSVTEAKMAIAMARLGGFGVIHKSLSIQEQVKQVKQVQQAHNVVIKNFVTLQAHNTVADCINAMYIHQISGVPIVKIKDKAQILVGIVTKRDLLYERNLKRPLSEIMSTNLITLQSHFNFDKAIKLMHQHKVEKLPLVKLENNDMILKGLITYKDVSNLLSYKNSFFAKGNTYFSAAAVGAVDLDRAKALIDANVAAIVLDSAHAHTPQMLKIVRQIKAYSKRVLIIAGNVATPEATIDLIKAGADIIKVGIGPGAACTTRIVCGVGYPQLSAVVNCSQAAKKHNVSVIADGGISYSGDIAKALAAGANSVMVGSSLAGCAESPGKILMIKNKPYKNYRGMGSVSAMQKGSADIHFQENKTTDDLIAEGIEGRVSYKGPVRKVVAQLIGGIKSSFAYVGAKNIAQLQTNAKFVRLTRSGQVESHPHDLIMTNEAPNYK